MLGRAVDGPGGDGPPRRLGGAPRQLPGSPPLTRSGGGVTRGAGGRGARSSGVTFDDGPDPRFTPEILAAPGTPAGTRTFFLPGPMVSRPRVGSRDRRGGHEIGVQDGTTAVLRHGARPRALHRRPGRDLRRHRGGDRQRPRADARRRGTEHRRTSSPPADRDAAGPGDYWGSEWARGARAMCRRPWPTHPGRKGRR